MGKNSVKEWVLQSISFVQGRVCPARNEGSSGMLCYAWHSDGRGCKLVLRRGWHEGPFTTFFSFFGLVNSHQSEEELNGKKDNSQDGQRSESHHGYQGHNTFSRALKAGYIGQIGHDGDERKETESENHRYGENGGTGMPLAAGTTCAS